VAGLKKKSRPNQISK